MTLKERNKKAVAKYRASKKGQTNRKKYYQENKEIILEKEKKYRESNKEIISKKNKNRYAKDKGYIVGTLKNTGSYNITNAEKNKENYLKENLIFYIIELEDLDGTVFYKAGLTKNIKNRFSNIPYNCKIIEKTELDKYSAIYKEREYLRGQCPYKPTKDFKGYTECFIVNN